jgi:signal transduction histidine kinase
VRLFRSTSFRLTAVYTAAFALAVVVLGSVTIVATRTALKRELDSRIRAEALALGQENRSEGLEGVLQAIRERDRTPGTLDYGLKGADGAPLAGRLAGVTAPDGWSIVRISESPEGGEDADRVRVLAMPIGGGRRLLVGEDLERVSTLDGLILRAFGWAFLGVVVLGAGAGFALSRDVERRFGEMSAAAEAIIDGDMGRRIPLKGSGDDLDALGATFNRMLDRIALLMDSLKQVSSDVAHDLRTPLTRLRQKLEASLHAGEEAERTATVESALQDVDAILDVFAALLRIAQIESGARRAGFRDVDLSGIAAAVVEAFAPSAEEGGRRLSYQSGGPLLVHGDKELLTQMLANLVENGLTHTPSGASIEVSTAAAGGDVALSVQDDGPGVPPQSRTKLFERFVRLENSRSTPGSGLGLALAAAVVRLHDGHLALEDAGPGLRVRVRFPVRPQGPWRRSDQRGAER